MNGNLTEHTSYYNGRFDHGSTWLRTHFFRSGYSIVSISFRRTMAMHWTFFISIEQPMTLVVVMRPSYQCISFEIEVSFVIGEGLYETIHNRKMENGFSLSKGERARGEKETERQRHCKKAASNRKLRTFRPNFQFPSFDIAMFIAITVESTIKTMWRNNEETLFGRENRH